MNRLLLVLLVTVSLVAVGCQHRLSIDKTELIYEDVTEAEAKAVGESLQKSGLISPDSPGSVRLDRKKELAHSPPTYRLTLTVKDGVWTDAAFCEELQHVANDMKHQLFHDEQTLLVLANQRGISQKTIYGRR